MPLRHFALPGASGTAKFMMPLAALFTGFCALSTELCTMSMLKVLEHSMHGVFANKTYISDAQH